MRIGLFSGLLAVVAAFAGGVLSPRLLERTAHAEQPAGSTVYVPSEGLTFRTFDGRVVAKLSYDAHGGVFDVYRESSEVSERRESVILPRKAPATLVLSRAEPVDLGF